MLRKTITIIGMLVVVAVVGFANFRFESEEEKARRIAREVADDKAGVEFCIKNNPVVSGCYNRTKSYRLALRTCRDGVEAEVGDGVDWNRQYVDEIYEQERLELDKDRNYVLLLWGRGLRVNGLRMEYTCLINPMDGNIVSINVVKSSLYDAN